MEVGFETRNFNSFTLNLKIKHLDYNRDESFPSTKKIIVMRPAVQILFSKSIFCTQPCLSFQLSLYESL